MGNKCAAIDQTRYASPLLQSLNIAASTTYSIFLSFLFHQETSSPLRYIYPHFLPAIIATPPRLFNLFCLITTQRSLLHIPAQMDRQSMQLGGAGGSGAATQEWLYPGAGGGGGQQTAQVVDDTFLMELLDQDAPATEQQPQEDVDQLSRVIQSLEAEIDGLRPPANDGGSKKKDVSSDVDGGLLDDMLSDLDSSPGPCVADEEMPPFEYWAEVPPAVGHDMGGWYFDGDGVMVGGYEFRDQCYYGYGESLAVDQVYSPLWE